MYIQFREGVPDEDRRRLFQHARLSRADQDAVNSLVHFGVRVTRVRCLALVYLHKFILRLQIPGDKDVRKKSKQKSGAEEYELSRYKPVVQMMLEVRATLGLFLMIDH